MGRIEQLKKFDELPAAMAVLDQGKRFSAAVLKAQRVAAAAAIGCELCSPMNACRPGESSSTLLGSAASF
jgi:hypothetical protein